MKTDRELLEFASKAAGIKLLIDTVSGYRNVSNGDTWNPLRDDGDALRLAVKLRIKFRYNEALGRALAWPMGAREAGAITVNIEDCERDECAAARRAIVRAAAAAAIGKTK